MGRMLKALKELESRRRDESPDDPVRKTQAGEGSPTSATLVGDVRRLAAAAAEAAKAEAGRDAEAAAEAKASGGEASSEANRSAPGSFEQADDDAADDARNTVVLPRPRGGTPPPIDALRRSPALTLAGPVVSAQLEAKPEEPQPEVEAVQRGSGNTDEEPQAHDVEEERLDRTMPLPREAISSASPLPTFGAAVTAPPPSASEEPAVSREEEVSSPDPERARVEESPEQSRPEKSRPEESRCEGPAAAPLSQSQPLPMQPPPLDPPPAERSPEDHHPEIDLPEPHPPEEHPPASPPATGTLLGMDPDVLDWVNSNLSDDAAGPVDPHAVEQEADSPESDPPADRRAVQEAPAERVPAEQATAEPATGEPAVSPKPPAPTADREVAAPRQAEPADRIASQLDGALEMPPETPSAPHAEHGGRGSAGMLNNRFHEPARPPAPATTLEEEVQRTLDDERLGEQYGRLAKGILTQYPGDVPAALMLVAPRAVAQQGETLMYLAAILGELLEEDEAARVLVVDSGLAEKSLTARMNAAGKPGLAEVLGRRKNWHDFVVSTSRPRVDFLPAGEGLVTSYKSIDGKLAPLVDEWKRHYRYVLIDAGAAAEPLTELLALVCDATYVHVVLRQTAADAARRAVEQLRTTGARLRGCVLNDAVA